MGFPLWASLSTTPREGTSAQNHEKSKFPVESYEFTLSNKNQSVLFLHRDFPCSMPALQNLTHQPAEAPFTWQGSQNLVKLLPHRRSFVSLLDLGIKYRSASSSSLFHFKCSSNDRLPNEAKWMISVSNWWESVSSKSCVCASFC